MNRQGLRAIDLQFPIIGEKVERYLTSLVPQNDAVLLRMEKDIARRSLSTIGPLVGRIFSMLLKSIEAERALEVGTSTGYSGIWIARSLQGSEKKLTTIELDPEKAKEAQANFKKAGVDKYVEVIVGDGRSLVPEISKKSPGSLDLVFLDVGDKTLYVDLLNHCIDALRTGGFLIADNTLCGNLVVPPKDNDPATVARTATIRKFNELVFSDRRLDAAIIPFLGRDYPPYAVTIAYKREK
jgi:predicted O-methyltransferase YrrM